MNQSNYDKYLEEYLVKFIPPDEATIEWAKKELQLLRSKDVTLPK